MWEVSYTLAYEDTWILAYEGQWVACKMWGGGCLRVHTKEYYSCVFLMTVDYLRLELPNIAEVAVYPATHYVQTTTNIVIYGSASLHPCICMRGDNITITKFPPCLRGGT